MLLSSREETTVVPGHPIQGLLSLVNECICIKVVGRQCNASIRGMAPACGQQCSAL